ncbi:MAG TPA: MotA/TolQ/ExbB proton channel family protein [Noviherbaspirillum sp.]|uniref:MotA/TolQ/ExbB proton channel family protein n=1 Tax=Noviherbaspirillum sp. TaxID=1926288 RepID=UPI002B48EEF1|nr:MotA/TolQ/ExbB proton channel family protein [Noviherbaspirillum sp.]HJV87642.1 MotA/TolQ/ExbB proton channel family protein [Noviherbaspirillum sp.]
MNEKLGIAHFWAQGDAVSHAITLALLLMSAVSWTIIVGKLFGQWRARASTMSAMQSFWNAASRTQALDTIRQEDRTGVFAALATDAVLAAQAWEEKAEHGIHSAGVDAGEFIGRTLQQSTLLAQARVERGLTFLASVGSTAPFVGLFGTVWGIYHALVGLSGATQVVLDKVAGPVGEALIMTAAGLFVAIPAVLAYNAFTRANRLVLAQLDGFAHSLHAWLVAGVRLDGQARAATVTALPAAHAH